MKELREAVADVRNEAIEKVQEIHREKTTSFEREWTDS